MTIVLEESEDIPFELISLLLSSVKKDNQVLRDGLQYFVFLLF